MRRHEGGFRIGLAALIVSALLVPSVEPAMAAVASVEPSSATITAGGVATATVVVTAAAVACLSLTVSPPSPTVLPSFAKPPPACDSATWTTQLTVTTTEATPPGVYDVGIFDDESSVVFSLTVKPAPTTTTVPPTTAPLPSTTMPATTTSARAPSTTAPGPPPGPGVFTRVADLVAASGPAEGLFLPLVGAAFQNCLPLTHVCTGPGERLILVPVAGAEVRWAPPPDEWRPPPALGARGVPPLAPVGATPARAASTFVLSVLDLASAAKGQLKSLLRSLDASGTLVAQTSDDPVVLATIEGPEIPAEDTNFLVASPFAAPYRVATEALEDAWPALVVGAGAVPQPIYALVAEPGWNLGVGFVPMLGTSAVPYLARDGSGSVGILLPLPAEAAPPAPATTQVVGSRERSGEGGGRFPVAVLLLVAVGVGAGVMLWRRQVNGRP